VGQALRTHARLARCGRCAKASLRDSHMSVRRHSVTGLPNPCSAVFIATEFNSTCTGWSAALLGN
jgi:hypothetical protein